MSDQVHHQTHLMLLGGLRRDRAAMADRLVSLPRLTAPISAHRRHRGPYTAAGTLLRALVPTVYRERPELVARHEVEILSAAPELRAVIPARLETLTSLTVPAERTRFYSRLRTRRIAHGLAEFLRDHLLGLPAGPRALVLDDVTEADPTDREFVAILLRRIDPGLLTVVVGVSTGYPEHPAADAREHGGLPVALSRHCRRVEVSPTGAVPLAECSGEHYVAGDGTDDDPQVYAAYQALSVVERQRLHDRRADELATTGEPSWGWGALPYHREHGGRSLEDRVRVLLTALESCMDLGFYDTTIELCHRGRALVDRAEQPKLWWYLTRKLPTCLSAVDRTEEALAVCQEGRAHSADPQVHILCSYATAMIHTRYLEEGSRDHELALAWINQAVALSSLLPDPDERAFRMVFNNNGRALIEAHRRRPEVALRLVTEGIAELDAQLGADDHRLHRSVLRANRAQVLGGLGRLTEAVDDLRAVIAADENHPEYHFELAGVLRKMGRQEEALAEYELAARLGPPFVEVVYNRADTRAGLGDLAGAVADLEYALELDPELVDAYVNLAGIRLDLGEVAAAELTARTGLTHDPDNPHLRSVLGRVHVERRDWAAALIEFGHALRTDPDFSTALACRAMVAYEQGDTTAALADLDRAVGRTPDDPELRYNRGFLHLSLGRLAEATIDLARAEELAPGDEETQAALRRCRAGMVTEGAQAAD